MRVVLHARQGEGQARAARGDDWHMVEQTVFAKSPPRSPPPRRCGGRRCGKCQCSV